jgi:hypothetical protein
MMTTYSVIETVVVAAAVATCAYMAFGRFAPRVRMRLQSNVGSRLDMPGRSGWMRALGRRMTAGSPASGCGDGCGSCGSCGPSDPKTIRVHKRK